MKSQRKRPFGVAFIALVFLWIGCLGTIFLPFALASGSLNEVWTALTGRLIKSAALLHITGYAVATIWYSLYVLYACVGFGLWRLRDWARRTVFWILALAGFLGLIVALIFVRPFVFGLAILLGTVLLFGWQIWYLQLPRVSYAFGVETVQEQALIPGPPPKPSNRRRAKFGAAILASVAILFSTVMLAVENMLRTSDICQTTLVEAQRHSCVATKIGAPFSMGWLISGELSETGPEGEANMNIPVRGAKGKGDLYVVAGKHDGIWTITSLSLIRGEDEDHLIPASAENCD